jgi:hypothetical protein
MQPTLRLGRAMSMLTAWSDTGLGMAGLEPEMDAL